MGIEDDRRCREQIETWVYRNIIDSVWVLESWTTLWSYVLTLLLTVSGNQVCLNRICVGRRGLVLWEGSLVHPDDRLKLSVRSWEEYVGSSRYHITDNPLGLCSTSWIGLKRNNGNLVSTTIFIEHRINIPNVIH